MNANIRNAKRRRRRLDRRWRKIEYTVCSQTYEEQCKLVKTIIKTTKKFKNVRVIKKETVNPLICPPSTEPIPTSETKT